MVTRCATALLLQINGHKRCCNCFAAYQHIITALYYQQYQPCAIISCCWVVALLLTPVLVLAPRSLWVVDTCPRDGPVPSTIQAQGGWHLLSGRQSLGMGWEP